MAKEKKQISFKKSVQDKSERYELYCEDAYVLLKKFARQKVKVDHIITDPPYNISKENNFATMSTAKRKGVDFGKWDKGFDLTGWIATAEKLLNAGGTFIIFNSYRNLTLIIDELEKSGLIVKDVLKWIKKNPMPRNINRRYVVDTEFAIWAVKPGKPWVFNLPADKKYLRAEFHTATVAGKEKTGHPTQKSLKLMQEIIEIHTRARDTILDPFMGSGTTGVAAIETGRKFVGIELDAKYYSIAESRIEKLKGAK